MSNLFKYKTTLDLDSAIEEKHELPSPYTMRYMAFILVGVIITTVFSTMVIVLNSCFPGSLDGTYLKLFF